MDSPDNTHAALWTRPYTLTILATFLIHTPFALFLPVLPVYVLGNLHGTTLAAGGVNAIFSLAVVLFRTQTERFEVMFGKRRVLFCAALLFACSNALFLFAGSVMSFMVIRFFSGAFFAVASTRLMAMGAELSPAERKAEGVAYVATAVTVGFSIGPFIGLTCARASEFSLVFWLSALVALCGALISIIIDMPEQSCNPLPPLRDLRFRYLFEARAIPEAIVIMLLMLAVTAVLSFASVYTDSMQLHTASTYYFVVLALCAVCSRLFAGRVYDRHGANRAIYPAIFVLFFGLFILGMARSSIGMFVSSLLIGFSYGILVPALQTLAFAKSPPHRTSAAAATYFTFFDLGMSAGAYLVGACIPYLGYAGIYLLLSLLVLSVALLYRGICDKKNPLLSMLTVEAEAP